MENCHTEWRSAWQLMTYFINIDCNYSALSVTVQIAVNIVLSKAKNVSLQV